MRESTTDVASATGGAPEGSAALDSGAGFGVHDLGQRPGGMTRVRRLAGPPQPRPSTPIRSAAPGQTPPRDRARPDRRPGRSRTRLSGLLSALALLLGALGLLAAAPAQAQPTVWSATMTVGDGGKWKGFQATSTGQLSDGDFTYGGVTYTISSLRLTNSGGHLYLQLNEALARSLVLRVGTSQFPLADAALSRGPGYAGVMASWAFTGLTWSVGGTVSLSLVRPATVRLSSNRLSEGSAPEGSTAWVKATLSEALSHDVTIPVTLTDNTAEPTDHGTLSGITIKAGETTGRGTITTAQDADVEDELFTVALGTLPTGYVAVWPGSVQIRILDDEGEWTAQVSLSATPNPVREGSSVSVEACLRNGGRSAVPKGTLRIPVALSHGSSEPGDWGNSLSGHTDGRRPIRTAHSIAISGSHQRSCGVVNIPTHRDSDPDDETFTVALNTANLPPGVQAGSPASVDVTIEDLRDWTTPTVSLSASQNPVNYANIPRSLTHAHGTAESLSVSPNPVAEGSDVLVTATLSSTLSTDVTIPLSLSNGTAEDGDYGSLSSITILAGFLSATGTITTTDDADADDETFTVALGTLPSGVAAGSSSSVTITITDNDATGTQTGGTLLERCASYLPGNAVSVAEVTGWRDAHSDTAHVLRWNRVLAALGANVGAGVSAMTVAESKTNESRFMRSRWARVTATLEAIETCRSGGQQRSSDPTVSLSVSPNRVAEGSSVRVTATLSSTLSTDVTIPLSLSNGTAEDGDYGSLSGITIPAGFSSATGTITTTDDGDADDETFTVALGTLPSGVEAGSSSSVTVTITDDDVTQEQTAGTLMERCASYLPSNAVSVSEVTGWRDAHSHDAAHVLRWNRVLKALGEDVGAGVSPMTVAEAKANEGRFMRSRWARVTKTLEAIQTCLANSGQNWAPTVQGLADLRNETGITYTLSGPLDPNIAEGKSYELKATASSPVQADTTVEIMLDAAASDADEDDYSVEAILIEAGETTGTTMLMVTADDLPDGGTGTNRTETLVLFGSVGGMKIGELTFTIWDAAVPALPVGGALALGLLLMWRGVVRARMRGAVSRRDEDG